MVAGAVGSARSRDTHRSSAQSKHSRNTHHFTLHLQEALDCWQETARQIEQFHQRYDVLLTPTVATLPLPHAALSATGGERLLMRLLSGLRIGRYLYSETLLDQTIEKGIVPLPFLGIANVTGQPAMSVPLHWSEEGLPVGSHFLAAKGRDGLLFNLARQLEQAAPWRDLRPPLNGTGVESAGD